MTPRQTLALFCLCLAAAGAPAQDAPLIKLSPAQSGAAGIAYGRIEEAGANGEAMRLAGSVVFPVQAMEVVSAPAAGVVQEVAAAPMQAVAAGAVLARLFSPQFLEWQRDYVQLATQERLAADKLARDEALHREGIIALSRLQDARNAQVQARVAAQERAQLLRLAGMNEAGLRALASKQALSATMPVAARQAGIVLELLAMPGQQVEAGAPLARLARAGELALELQATRAQADRIQPGDKVEVDGCPRAGKVSAISPQVNAASQAVLVRAQLPQAGQCLRPNQYIDAVVSTRGERGGLSVPSAALLRMDAGDYLMLREADGVRPVRVTVLSRGAERSVVRAGLKPGSEVAVQGMVALKGMWMGLGAQGEGK
ncbi:efflux RND transporter periplasmic adaptor subunit [Noviherbaspirillum soli]|uniref:efflux RND transporter periplasmic adaptor subunit n=1 Tax=Noviherbaspirillum soli TaxID=1064518 RepID=UPI00188B3D32|nr:efflux RND transporter periplasmic adaptor subunit [Noviherbaspirillum soli]